jgi:hypothetical protein
VTWLRKLWGSIAQPRVQRVGFFVLYGFHLVAGSAVVIGEPNLFHGISGLQTLVWGGFLVLGGLLGMLAVLPGWNYIERVGILSIMVGIAIYSVLLAFSPTDDVPLRIAFWCFVSAWIVVFVLRTWEIRLYLIAPRK